MQVDECVDMSHNSNNNDNKKQGFRTFRIKAERLNSGGGGVNNQKTRVFCEPTQKYKGVVHNEIKSENFCRSKHTYRCVTLYIKE